MNNCTKLIILLLLAATNTFVTAAGSSFALSWTSTRDMDLATVGRVGTNGAMRLDLAGGYTVLVLDHLSGTPQTATWDVTHGSNGDDICIDITPGSATGLSISAFWVKYNGFSGSGLSHCFASGAYRGTTEMEIGAMIVVVDASVTEGYDKTIDYTVDLYTSGCSC